MRWSVWKSSSATHPKSAVSLLGYEDADGFSTLGPDGVVLDYATQLNAVRELRATLRAAAEELGQLRPKVDLDGQTLRIEIVGVNLDDL